MRVLFTSVVIATAVALSAGSVFGSTAGKLGGFQTLRWGDSESSIRQKLARNYVLGPAFENDIRYEGMVGGFKEVSIYPVLHKKKLAEVHLVFDPEKTGVEKTDLFIKVTSSLLRRYGDSRSTIVARYRDGRAYRLDKFLHPDRIVGAMHYFDDARRTDCDLIAKFSFAGKERVFVVSYCGLNYISTDYVSDVSLYENRGLESIRVQIFQDDGQASGRAWA